MIPGVKNKPGGYDAAFQGPSLLDFHHRGCDVNPPVSVMWRLVGFVK
jgi:hypothetical protein